MPLVLIKKDELVYDDTDINFIKLINFLPDVVAEALSVPGTDGELTPAEIEVCVSDFNILDRYSKPLMIIVMSNEYPERLQNLEKRASFIAAEIRKQTGIQSGFFVWVHLVKGAFVEY